MKTYMFLNRAALCATLCIVSTPAFAMNTAATTVHEPPKIDLQRLDMSAADLSLLVNASDDTMVFIAKTDAGNTMRNIAAASDTLGEQSYALDAVNYGDTADLNGLMTLSYPDTGQQPVRTQRSFEATDDQGNYDLANAVHGQPLAPMLATESPQGGPLGTKVVGLQTALTVKDGGIRAKQQQHHARGTQAPHAIVAAAAMNRTTYAMAA